MKQSIKFIRILTRNDLVISKGLKAVADPDRFSEYFCPSSIGNRQVQTMTCSLARISNFEK